MAPTTTTWTRLCLTSTTSLAALLVLSIGTAGCNTGSRDSAATAAALNSGAGAPLNSAILNASLPSYYALNVAVSPGGNVLVDPPLPSAGYLAGTTITLEARPDAGSFFKAWGGALGSDDRYRLSFQITADTNLSPEFEVAAAGTPVAGFGVTGETNWVAPLSVQFNDQSTGAVDRHVWEFGDGTTSDQPSPSHTYSAPGEYTVVLKVFDDQGQAGPALVQEKLVTVVDPSQGSRFWYSGDTYGNPAQENTVAERSVAQQVLDLCNQERAAVGAPPLTMDVEAERAAKAHSNDMVQRGYFDHVSAEGWTPGDRLRATGAGNYVGSGENIAAGQQSPAEVMQAWMTSPGHRANILNPDFTHLGVGVVIYQGTTPLWTQVFLQR